MIAWRTSRYLLFFFLILLSVVVISAAVKYGNPALFQSWRAFVLARVNPAATPAPTTTPQSSAAAELPNFPPVHIEVPAQSPFDPSSASGSNLSSTLRDEPSGSDSNESLPKIDPAT